MSKKICFSSVLKEKRGQQNILNKPVPTTSLRLMMQDFTQYPNDQYVLRYNQTNSLRGCNSRQGFDQGYNQLDQWIHHQIHNNKENISDTQPRRQIPNQLLKYAQGACKSPRRLSQVKSDFLGSQNMHRNADMKEICREYVENKKSGKDMSKEGPVWRFSSKHSEQDYEDQSQSKEEFQRKTNKYLRQNENEMQPMKQQNNRFQEYENQKSNQQSHKLKVQSTKNIVKNSTQSNQNKNQNILKLVEEIKSNIVPEIEVMAERIINQRALGQQQDQQLLISQRETQEQKDQKRIEKAKKEIGQYLTMKNGPTSSQSEPRQTGSRKTHGFPVDHGQQKINSSDNHAVGYSFSSDFQSQNIPQSFSAKNSQSYNISPINQQTIKMKKGSQIFLNPASNISLPNIDEVKSQRDAYQKLEQDFSETVPKKSVDNAKQQENEIDKNFIKQIQSVAYVETHHVEKNSPIVRQEIKTQGINTQVKQAENKGSLFNQISKTAMSINEGQVNQGEEVNISIAEKRQQSKISSKNGSAKNNQVTKVQKNSPAMQVSSFVAAPVKIQFKKVPSPERALRRQQNETGNQPPNVTESKSSVNYFARVYTPEIVSAASGSSMNQNYKTSFTNIIGQAQKSTQRSIQQVNPVSSINPPQTALYSVLTPNPTSVLPVVQAQPPSSSIGSQNYNQYHQNSRQRNNSMKNSNQEESKKIKITISPKYHGNEAEIRQQIVGNVTDFKIGNPKLQQNSQAYQNRHQAQTSEVTFTSTHPSTTIVAQNQGSIGSQYATHIPVTSKSSLSPANPNQQSFAGTRFKVDTLFSNTATTNGTTVTQIRQIHQQERQKGEQHAMIRVEKFERVEVVENKANPKQSISSRNKESIKSSQQFEFDLDF